MVVLEVQKSAGIRGKRNQERIDPGSINDDFVLDFPLTTFQKIALETVYSMRTVTTSQLAEITGYSIDHVREYMLKLHLNRFVFRQFPPKDLTMPGSKQAYYLLDEAGAIYISGAYGISMKELKWNKRDNLVKYDTLNHTFRVSETRAKLEIEAREKKQRVLNCWSDRHLFFNFNFEDNKYFIRPDMYFIYEDNENQYSFFIEVDMGTENVRAFSKKTISFDAKVPVYENFKLSGDYKNAFEVFPRILVITTSAARAKQLCQAVKEKQKTKVEFLFTTFPLWDENCTGPIFMKTDGSFSDMFS